MMPVMRELIARPVHPHLITKPMAAPVVRGNASPTMARVVEEAGAMESPARKMGILGSWWVLRGWEDRSAKA